MRIYIQIELKNIKILRWTMKFKQFLINEQNLKELTKHYTGALPIACYETTILEHASGYIPLHWHDEIQLIYVLKGEAVFQVNEEKIKLRSGDGLFINSGCLHMAEDLKKTGCVYICLNVLPHLFLPQELYTTYVLPYVQSTNLSYVLIDGSKEWSRAIQQALFVIRKLVQAKEPLFEIEITANLIKVWKQLLVHAFQKQYVYTEEVKNQRIKAMLTWVHMNYSEKITLDDIAASGQISRSECCRYFKRMLDVTPLQYVMKYRIQKSILLLKQEEKSITDVAFEVGFNSTSYFIDQFKKTMGMTPLAYRKGKL